MADPITQPVVPTSVSNAASAAGVTLTAQQPTGYTPPNPPSQPTLGAAGYTVPTEDPTVAAGTAFEAAQANAPYDPDKIKSDTIAGFQNQIDALKQVYSQKLADAHAQGLNRLGQASVGQSRAGLIGSGSAGQQNDTIQSDNNSIEGGITAEENSAIAGINSTAQTAANDAADKALAAKNSGINAYTASINAKAATTKDLITKTAQNILAGGLSDATLTPDFFNQVAQNFSNSGYTVTGADLKAAYAAAKTAKDASDAATAKAGQTTLSEGQSIVGPDGKVVASVAPKQETEIRDNVNGRTVLVDKATGETIKDLGATTTTSGSGSNQDTLEQQGRQILAKEFSSRSGTYGLNDAKVSQANKLATLFNQSYDSNTGNYNLTKSQYGELAEGLASLISGSTNGASDADVAALKTATAKGDWNKVYTYVTGDTANGSTQDIINSLAQSVEREATQAVTDRQTDEQKLVGLLPTDLEDSRKQALIANASIPYTGIEGQQTRNSALVSKAFSDPQNSSLNSIGYQGVIDRTPAGQKAVVDKKSGAIGYIPINEFNQGQYTPL